MQSVKENNRLNKIIETAVKSMNGLIDVNTVVGKPLENGEDVIIPISKVTFCVLSGGGEYGKINIFKNGSDLPYSAGNGAVVSVKPSGFLIKEKDGEYKVLTVKENSLDNLIDKTTDFLVNIGKSSTPDKQTENDGVL